MTAGDPRGIGPEIINKALADPRIGERSDLVVVGAEGCGLEVDESIGEWTSDGGVALAGQLSGKAIERAVELAMQGKVQGIVTAPIDKSALLAGGYDFPGHTEMLAELTGARVAMMLASTQPAGAGGSPLRVVLATTHVALRDVPDALTGEKVISVAAITREYLTRWFGIESPRIALCALNPHAGDGGRFGWTTRDESLLGPAARLAGIAGPYSRRHRFRPRDARRVRCRDRAVSRRWHDRDQGRGVRQRRERHARLAVPPNFTRSRHCARHCRSRDCRPVELYRGAASVPADCVSRSCARRSPAE